MSADPEPARSQTISFVNNPPLEESEDCLYINVWAPSSPAPTNGRAVMFWLYGGNLRIGGTSAPFYEGTNLAAVQDVVVVSPGYRTNGMAPRSPSLIIYVLSALELTG